MHKTILITGSTDGIGLETARILVAQGHHVLLHGRNAEKLAAVKQKLCALTGAGNIESYVADLSRMADVASLAKQVTEKHKQLDVLINNAGIFKSPSTITQDGLDVRFAVNTLAPYLLTQKLLPLMKPSGRVINLSSAAQSSVNLEALTGKVNLSDDYKAYAQSKLAITMWSYNLAHSLKDKGPVVIAVNPGSLLGTKMVKEGFGIAGKEVRIGADILVRLALADEFENASGKYFDNDSGRLSSPHADALDLKKCEEVVRTIELVLSDMNI